MFSHLIGNLCLRGLDERMVSGKAAYFRYVDDIALVGTVEEVRQATRIVRAELDSLGLVLHDETSSKTLNIGGDEWLQGEHDFVERKDGISWMSLIGDLKRFLLWHPGQTTALEAALKDHGFRIPVPNYSSAIKQATFVDRARVLIARRWFQIRTRQVSVASILRQAVSLRDRFDVELEELLRGARDLPVFNLKRVLPKARYRLGRLAYLAQPDRLAVLAREAAEVQGLTLQAEVGQAIATGRVDRILTFGTNATQAVAQPLRMAAYRPTLSRSLRSKVDINSFAVLQLNGVASTLPDGSDHQDDLLRFAMHGADMKQMKSAEPFIREIACLHGMAPSARHMALLDSAFDQAEEVALDAIDQARESLSL